MTNAVNVYKKLNKREKYILETLDIKIEDKPITYDEVDCIIKIINNIKDRVSPLPITNEQFRSAYGELEKSYISYFPNEEIMLQVSLHNKWPDKKINVLRTLSDESVEIINMLGFKLEDREIDAKEFMKFYEPITNCLLLFFGTGIKTSECDKLINKIRKIFFSQLNVYNLISNNK